MSMSPTASVLAVCILVFGVTGGRALAGPDGDGSMIVLKGVCNEKSHIAEGSRTEDLTKRQSRFFCDSAVIIHPNGDPKRVLITFTESQSNTGPQIGFAGSVSEPDMAQISRVYLRSGVATAADDGACKFFRKDGKITSLFCGAKLDIGERRTVPIVAFEVGANSRPDGPPQPDQASTKFPPYRESGVATCTCPGTSIEFYIDGQGGAQITNAKSNYSGFTNAARVKRWTASLADKDGQKLLVLDNGQRSRIMADPSSGKAMGFLADGGVSDMLCQVLVKPR
jgi:hypothetical protein